MNILVVEDEDMILEGICEYLGEHEYYCIAASDGQEAIEKFKNNEIHLVLLDIMLPKLNGIEVLQYIRKTSKIPVLMLTAFNDDDYKIKLFQDFVMDILKNLFHFLCLKQELMPC